MLPMAALVMRVLVFRALVLDFTSAIGQSRTILSMMDHFPHQTAHAATVFTQNICWESETLGHSVVELLFWRGVPALFD